MNHIFLITDLKNICFFILNLRISKSLLISLLLLLPKLRLWYYLLLPSYCSYPLIPLIYFPFRRWKFIKFTPTFPACIFTIDNTTTSVAHFSYIFSIKTKFRFAHVFWLLGNIKQPPLTPKLSTACAGVDLTLPTMTSHGAYIYSHSVSIIFISWSFKARVVI